MLPSIGKIKLPIIAPIKPPAIDNNADEFLPPYIFIVKTENKNSINSKNTQIANAINKKFLPIISKPLQSPNKKVKNKKIKTNGTIDFVNGQKGFLSKSIYNVVPKVRDLIIFPNYLMHTAYPFNIDGERRSFSFNAKIIIK